MIKEKSINKQRYYIPPPVIPGIIYTKKFTQIQSTGLISCFLILIMTLDDVENIQKILLAILLLAMWIGFFLSPSKTKKVYIDPTHVNIEYDNGQSARALLEDHFLHIGEAQKRTPSFSNYAYAVSLIPKESIKAHNKSLIIPFKNKQYSTEIKIPLCPRIYRPDNVNEYVESFLKQINLKIVVIFESEKISQDCNREKIA